MCWYQYTMLGKGNEWLSTIFVFLMIPQNHPDKIITSIHISTTIFAFEHGRHFMSKLRKQWKLKKRYHFAGNYWTELIHHHHHPTPHPQPPPPTPTPPPSHPTPPTPPTCTKWLPFHRRYFHMHFHKWNVLYFGWNFAEFSSEGPNWQWPSICLDNGLTPNRRQANIWTNADPIHWRIYAAVGGDELNLT